jgi:hypothetical protein
VGTERLRTATRRRSGQRDELRGAWKYSLETAIKRGDDAVLVQPGDDGVGELLALLVDGHVASVFADDEEPDSISWSDDAL